MAHQKTRQTASGPRYDVRWALPGGQERRKSFRRKADADSFRRQVEADEMRGVITDPRRQRVTLSDLADRWMKARTTKRPRSVQRDRQILDKHVLPTLGNRRVGTLSRAEIQALVDGWVTAGLAASTVGRQYSALRALMSFAESSEIIARSPCRGIRLPQVRLVDRPHIEPAQLARLADVLGPQQAAFMWLGAVLGLRWSEAAGLRVGDIDLERCAITVELQLGRDGSLVPPKTANARRTIAAPEWLIDALKPLLAGREADELVFLADKSGPLDYSHWRTLKWTPATKKAKLPGLRFHDLRSLAATALVAAGVDVKTAQTRLGHSSPSVTLGLYARVTQEADRLAADAVGDLFRPRN